ncbi:hypothetical protein GLE_2478 [Lysobacter enzymogenes]|uniref:DUF4142 domain-containing protein n=1 Tax=Lysobacter enzymogenes TaxID=69 RepID=A0A0S2DHE6_LYSEN|nr:hypothetical protein GLE_2478 [Lysobacter enzymogenes]
MALLLAAAAPAQDPPPTRTTSPAHAGIGGHKTAEATQRDADSLALGLLAALDENEIAAAQQAQQKRVSGPYLEFARMMQTQHGENLRRTRQLGVLSASAEVEALKSKGRAELAELGRHQGRDYESAYAKAMVAGHQDALDLVDRRLSELARSAAVKRHLAETRQHVAMHLALAKGLPAVAATAAR